MCLDYSKCFMLPKPDEGLHYFNCVFCQSLGWETLNEESLDTQFIKETKKLCFSLGTVCKCILPDSERNLTVLLVFIVNRSTSIWYLLEIFQCLSKQHFFCSLVPLALHALNLFKCESAHPLELKLPIVINNFLKGLLSRSNLVEKGISPCHISKVYSHNNNNNNKIMLTIGRHRECIPFQFRSLGHDP